jgi:hypothetical protein
MRGAKGEKRKRIGKLTDKEQSERFIREARKLSVDESGKAFEGATRAFLKPKDKPKGGNS